MATHATTTTYEHPKIDLSALDVISPGHCRGNGYLQDEWQYLRAHAPVFFVEREGVNALWAITKDAALVEFSQQPRLGRAAEFSAV